MASASGRRNCSLQELLAIGFPFLASLHVSPWSDGFGGEASDNHLTSFTVIIKRASKNSLYIIVCIWVSTGQSNTSRKGGRSVQRVLRHSGSSSARQWRGEGRILPTCLRKLWPAPSLFVFLLGKMKLSSLIPSVTVKWSWWKWFSVRGGSLLKGSEGLLSQTGSFLRDVCCLPRVQIKDVKRNLSALLWVLDFYPLLIFQIGKDKFMTRISSKIKRGIKGLGQQVKGSGAQAVLTSLFSCRECWGKKQEEPANQ